MTDPQQLERLKKLEYRLLSGKGMGDIRYPELHNRAYDYWKNFWSAVYEKQGSLDAFCSDDFSRQDVVAVLSDGPRIVSLHLNTVFQLDLRFVPEHRYFKFYPIEFIDFLKDRGAKAVLSIEYLTVDPQWRKSFAGVSLGEVMIGCAIKLGAALRTDAVVATARTEHNVNRMGYNFGIECWKAGITKRNFSVDLTAGFQNQLHSNPDTELQALVDHYWSTRRDETGLTLDGNANEALIERIAA